MKFYANYRNNCFFIRVTPRRVIIRQGHKGMNFYFVISGTGVIKTLQRRADGSLMNKDKIVFRIGPGSSFGVNIIQGLQLGLLNN